MVRASVRDVVGGCKFGKGIVNVRVVSKWNEMSDKENVEPRTKEISNFVNVISWSVVWKKNNRM